MRLSLRDLLATILLLTWTETAASKKLKDYQCPLGFKLAYTEEGRKPVCYRLKDTPEAFTDKFKDCTGNIFSSALYHSLNFTKTKHVIWTDLKSMYPGGPFVDWSYTDSTGKPFMNSFDVKYDSSLGIDDELCVVVDPVSNFTAVGCNDDETHYRYCFVKPYDEDDRSTKGCKGVGNYSRFFSPVSTCLTAVSGAGGGGIRANWVQAMEMCSKREGILLHKGWRLSNSPLLNSSESRSIYPLPLGMIMDHGRYEENILKGIESRHNKYVIPESEWHFDRVSRSSEDQYVSLANDTWRLIDSSFIFYHVICERFAKLENIKLDLYVDDKDLILKVNNTIKKNEIRCFTDSQAYYPSQVKINRDDDDDKKFHVVASSDGYYWCMQTDYKTYHVSESKKILFVRDEDDTRHLYACKIRVSNNYRLGYLDSQHRYWKEKLKQFIYYRTLYIEEYGDSEIITEEMLLSFKRKKELEWREPYVIKDSKIKRLYLDSRTVLLHIELNPEMKPLLPGTKMMLASKDQILEVVFMRPAYLCKGFESLSTRELGGTVISGCSLFSCVGDYNEGVQWVETAIEGCTSTTTEPPRKEFLLTDMELLPEIIVRNVSSPANSTTESTEPTTEWANETDTWWVNETSTEWNETTIEWTTENIGSPEDNTTETDWSTITTVNTPTTDPPTEVSTVNTPETTTVEATVAPTTTARPPQEQLQEVIGELEQLLMNDTVPLESLEQPFSQVNDILNVEDEDFEITSNLLHLLDQLANRVSLGAEQRAVKIRDNVAMMIADATPDNPIRGVRVTAGAVGKSAESFSNRTFDFIEGEIDSAELLSSESEAVVYLPASVTRESRRISFVAFRNQRAFQSDYTVNSRVFSVNVENLTHFERGEVIDIHLTPLVGTPERDQRRVCAFWKFEDNGTGHWARDGCRLIRSSRAGAMDTCRCDHLTHFAEVLIPRTVFSERNEQALEILSVIGCCISMLGLLLIGITAALFRSWRRDYSNKIWLQLCVSIFLVAICFLVAVYADFERYDVPCMLFGVILHYSVVASFCWMLVAAVLSYRRLVLVFTRDVSHKLLRASAFAWGAPCAVVGILLAINPQAYAGRFEELEPVRTFCYPTGLGLWLAVFAPIALILLANWTLFILIVRSVFASRRIQRHGDSNEALRCASVSCLLVFLFGLPWVIGLFATNLVMAYIFCLSANYQGFVLFVFFVVGNKKTRDLWLNKLKIKQTRKVPVTSSTYTNRSVGAGWRAGAEGPSSIEAKTSKPRSLTSPDDSRFS